MSLAKGPLGRSVKSSAISIWLIAAGSLCAVAIGQVSGQRSTATSQAEVAAAKTPAYEVVSVRQSKGDSDSARIMAMPDGFSMRNLTLEPLISDAYGVILNEGISGWPRWASSARFDIEAKMDVETADALRKLSAKQQETQRQLMLQAFLSDRFKLKVHRATEVRTTYELVLAKGGSKMQEDNPDTDRDGVKLQEGVRPATDWTIAEGQISGHAMPISVLTDHLQGPVSTIVVDKTGLTKRYDVLLQWDPTGGQNPSSTEPSIFTALQEQLGLQLKPVKTTVEMIVIDHLEMPSEN
jgi:uncharacterized protein (TIGR03435 family)